jgi:dipeptidase D
MQSYLDIFKQLCAIPRPSHHEEEVADFLCNFAKEHGLTYRRDEHNCVVIEKPATPGYEDREPIVILNHMDMVCVAEEGYPVPGPVKTIEYEENGERWMRADHTSLGADNGIGLSMALAILADDSLPHPALEVLTTTCEETDMSGAAGLASDFFKGRRVLNIDSEAYNEITVASAGAHIQVAHLPYRRTAMPKDYITLSVSVAGGRGGHSGVDIGSGRANAIKILCNLLLVAIRQTNIKLYLINIKGGQAYSAIPCEAEAKICIPKENAQTFEILVSQCNDAIKAQYSETDPDVMVSTEPAVWHSSVINEEGTHLILASVNGIPSGPVTMRPDGGVETSNNIGIIDSQGERCTISSHTRSFSMQALEELADNISKIFTLTGAEVETIMHLSSWQEDLHHPWVQQVMNTFQQELGFTPTPVSMHFALEAGYFVEKFPGIHIASIGPRIMFPHSPNEKVSLTTADNIWHVVREICKD